MDDFKDHLKSELEVFITTIFLRILESENSTYDHKLRVLEVFHRICKDSSALVEIFINYDCEMEAIDLFRRVVDGFAKIAKVRTHYDYDENDNWDCYDDFNCDDDDIDNDYQINGHNCADIDIDDDDCNDN